MEGKSSEWRPGPTVCRCCLSEGCYKDISTEYFWMGKREVYAEMLSETLSLSIAYSTSTGPNSNSRLICEQCISRLRDASEFKRQVADCEKTFMQHLDPSSSKSRELDTIGDVKVEVVKHEKDDVSEDDFDDRPDFLDVDSDDDLDNQPLTKLATKTPKKELDILDLLDNSQITVKRKSNLKTKEPPKKVAKKKESKPASSKASPTKPEKKKELNPLTITRKNARTIVENSTAYPFRLPESSMMCILCNETFSEAATFRTHMNTEHDKFYQQVTFTHVSDGQLKVDITELLCRLCVSTPFHDLQDIAHHLVSQHSKRIDFTMDLGLQPYRLENEKFVCAICQQKTSNLCALSRHTGKHFKTCICEHCGKAYATNGSLMHHVRYTCTKDGQMRCRKCRKVVSSINEHLKASVLCRQHICGICGERFATWKAKHVHMENAHAMPKKTFPCPECIHVFKTSSNLKDHFSLVHTLDYLECVQCGLKFTSQYKLDRHMIIHTGEKHFVCDVCNKSFNRKSTLNQHMWIHSEIKRHNCKLCGKSFNQKVCLKVHMKSQHPGLDDIELVL